MTFNSLLLKLRLTLVFSAFLFQLYGQSVHTIALTEIDNHRKEKTETFKSDKSPLPVKERKKFKGLKYFPVDLKYRVDASFVKTENPVLFKMKTSTTRLPDYLKYGEVHFTIDGQSFMLEVYQSPDIQKMEGYEDHLFIPFTDETNGKESYEVGRYLEMKIPTTDEVILDFNLSYNPYCSYSPNYSCPIPPKVNHLPIEVKAGEKKYKNH